MNINSFLDKAIYFLLVSIICIMLIIGFLFVTPVYVHADDFFSGQPIPSTGNDPQAIKDGNFYIYSNGRVGSDLDKSVYIFAIRDGNYIRYCLVSSELNVQTYLVYGDQSSASTLGQTATLDSDTGLYYYRTTSYNVSLSSNITIFDSIEDGLSSVNEVINSSQAANLYEGFRLPAGYVAVIQGSSVSFDLYTDMPEYSSIKQWAYSTQRYGIESSLPSQASFDYDYGTRIIWHITGDTNLLGEGYHAASSLSASVGSGYLLLVNPAYYGSTANIMNADMFNGVVTLSNVHGVDSIRLYSLGSYIASGGITSDYSTSSAINNAAVVVTNGGFYIENSDGTLTPVYDLPSFGDTSVDGSSSGIIAKFRAILEGVVEKIESLLIAPVEYINRLIVAASNFFAWLSGLWSWLPPAVSGVLTSVLYIMAIVGALKLLWR